MASVLGIDLHQQGVELVPQPPGFRSQCLALAREKVENDHYVLGANAWQIRRLLQNEHRHSSRI
jgi:hypothetical protein